MLIALHIPKTAGTTFKFVLKEIFHDDIHLDYFHDEYVLTDPNTPTLYMRFKRFKRSLKFPTTVPPTTKCIYGHFRPTKYLQQFPDAQLVTWLRNPVDRVVSHYYYWRAFPDKRHSIGRMVTRGLSLEEFASIDAMRNLQTAYFEGLPMDRFGFVGIQEHFDEMVGHFCRYLNVPVVHVKPRNINKSKEKVLDARLAARIEELNELDMKLYESAMERARKEGMIR